MVGANSIFLLATTSIWSHQWVFYNGRDWKLSIFLVLNPCYYVRTNLNYLPKYVKECLIFFYETQ